MAGRRGETAVSAISLAAGARVAEDRHQTQLSTRSTITRYSIRARPLFNQNEHGGTTEELPPSVSSIAARVPGKGTSGTLLFPPPRVAGACAGAKNCLPPNSIAVKSKSTRARRRVSPKKMPKFVAPFIIIIFCEQTKTKTHDHDCAWGVPSRTNLLEVCVGSMGPGVQSGVQWDPVNWE